MDSWPAFAAVCIGAALATALVVKLVRAVGSRRGLLDHPNARSSHTVPTPRGGGIGIVLAILGGIALVVGKDAALMPLGLGTACLAVVGFIDDLRGLNAIPRLLAHVLIAIVTVSLYGALRKVALPGLPVVDLGTAGAVLTVTWIVGLTNAYNFMDGIDGIAAGQAVIAGFAWMLLFLEHGHETPALIAGVVAGASAGFLVFNWSPASIFMGDVGSGALGYVFATMPLLLRAVEPDELSGLGWFFGVTILVPFIFDTAYTFIARAGRRENVLQAHRSHLYQRLVGGGLSHARVAAIYIGLALYTSSLAFAAVNGVGWATIVGVAIPLVLLVAGVRVMERNLAERAVRSDA